MADESLTEIALDTLTAGIASEVISFIKHKVVESQRARILRDKLGIEGMDEISKKIIRTSISNAFPKNNTSKEVIKDFLKDTTNRKIFSQWIIDPDVYSATKKNLTKKYALSKVEKEILDNFIEKFIQEIGLNRRKEFPTYAVSILDELNNLSENVDNVKNISQETLNSVNTLNENIATKEDIRSMIIDLTFQADSSKKVEVSDIKALLDKGKLIDARKQAKKLIENTNTTDKKLLCELNRLIANSFLDEESDQRKAIPFLQKCVELCKNEDSYRTKALMYLLQGEKSKALIEAENFFKINETVDSIGLMANILWSMDNPNKAYEFLSEKKYPNSYKHEFNLAYAAFLKADFEVSIQHAEKVIDINPEYIGAYELLSNIKSIKYQKNIDRRETFWPGKKDLEQLENAEEKASEAIKRLDKQQRSRLSRNLANRAIIRHWSGKDQEALEDLEKASKLTPEDPDILRNLSFFHAAVSNFEQALTNFKKIIDLKEGKINDNDLIRLYSEILLGMGEPEKAVLLLEDEIELKNLKKDSLEICGKLVESYDRSFETDKAEALLTKLEYKFPNSPLVQLTKAKHLHLIGEFEKALEAIEKVEEETTGKIKILLKIEKADIYYERANINSFNTAAKIYGELCNLDRNDFLLRRYALSLYNSRQYKKCLNVCDNILKEKQIKLFIRLEAEIYYHTHNFEAAKVLYRWLSIKDPDIVEHSIKFAVSLFRLNERNKAFQVVRQVANKIKDSASDFLNVAYTFASIGKDKEAAKYADKAIRIGADDSQINRGYILIWLRQIKDRKGIPKKHIEKFQEVLNTFNDKFPGREKFFEMIETPIDDLGALKNEILQRLPSQEWENNVHELFQEKKYPIELLSKVTGKDLYACWHTVISHPNYGLFTNSGNSEELEQEIKLIEVNKSVIIDPIALFTLNYLNKLNSLLELFEEIHFPQLALDKLIDIKELEETSIESGKFSLYKKDGKIYKHEVSSDILKQYIEGLNIVIGFITSKDKNDGKVKLIGKSIDRYEPKDFTLLENLGEITSELLLESNARSLPIYCEDYFIRMVAGTDFDTSGFGIRTILQSMLNKNLITEEEYEDSLIELVKANYHFINISVNTLIRLAERNSYIINEEVLNIFDEFRRDQIYLNLINMICQFLKWFWDEISMDKVREDWTFAALNSISEKIEKRKIASEVVAYSRENFHPLDSLKKQKFEEVVKRWLKSQSII